MSMTICHRPVCAAQSHSEAVQREGHGARVFTAYCEEGNAPYFCPPENIEEGEPGEYIYKRKYRFIFGQPGKHNDHITKLLIVGDDRVRARRLDRIPGAPARLRAPRQGVRVG